MKTVYNIIIYVSLILLTSGEPVPCNDHSVMGDDGIQCKCRDASFYNSNEGKCQGVCEYFGNTICTFYERFAHTVCTQSNLNPMDYGCQCAPGYELDYFSETCIDEDECNSTLRCSELGNEMCYNLEGGDVCDCIPNYFRNQNNVCQEIDLCNMPDTVSPCQQVCNFTGNYSYECSCNPGFVVDHHNDSACSVDVGHLFVDCFCQSPDISDCSHSVINSSITYCYPSPGFEYNSDHIIVDINECMNGTYQCPLKSTCVNDYGSYHCECFPGYYQVDDDFILSGCEPMYCADGLILNEELGVCVDPCDGLRGLCPQMSVCFTNEGNAPKCNCQIECQNIGLPNSSTFSIYSLTIYLPYEDANAFELTKKKYLLTTSMELIFGKGNAQVVEDSIQDGQSGLRIALEIGVPMPLEDISIIGDLILRNCWALKLKEDDSQPQCVLPGGLIINRYSILVEEIYRCEDSTLCGDISHSICVESNVSLGRYWCPCMDGFEKIEDFYCQDINECITGHSNCEEGLACVNYFGSYSCEIDVDGIASLQLLADEADSEVQAEEKRVTEMNQDILDQTKTTKTVGGVTGGIFGVIFIILAVALVYVFRTRSKEDKYSPAKEGKDVIPDSPSSRHSDPSQALTVISSEQQDSSLGPSDLSPGTADLTSKTSNLSLEPSGISPEPSDLNPEPSTSSSQPLSISTEPSDPYNEYSKDSPQTSVPSQTPEKADSSSEISDLS